MRAWPIKKLLMRPSRGKLHIESLEVTVLETGGYQRSTRCTASHKRVSPPCYSLFEKMKVRELFTSFADLVI